MDTAIEIRPAEERDIPAIVAVTNASIARDVAHFATSPDDESDVLESFRRDRTAYPWFVACDDDGRVLGFSRAARWKTREAYDWTCESAVYLAVGERGRGLGERLYRALFAELERRGFRCVLAGVAVPNPSSERLHEAMGMEVVGEFPAVGFKHGRWLAVRYYCARFGDGGAPERIGASQ